MAEVTTLKRFREEVEEESQKRQKSVASYNQILSLLEDDEDEPNQDLSSLINTLQQEISSSSSFSSTPDLQTSPGPDPSNEDDKEGVIRHLLEASDDELGISNAEFDLFGGGYKEYDYGVAEEVGGFWDGLWEFEDETANYYAMLQSELFL